MNQFNWWDNNIQASLKAGALRLGKRFDGVINFYKVMTRWDGDDKSNEEILVALPKTLIWTPALPHAGQVFRPNMAAGFDAIMYLSPSLEFESQAFINHTVAHEFAHVHLGHHVGEGSIQLAKAGIKHGDQQHEREADALAAEWRFKRVKDTWMSRTMIAFAKSIAGKPRLCKKFMEALK